MKPTSVEDTSFSRDVLKNKKPVLVDFWAPWCGPCKELASRLEEVAHEYGLSLNVKKLNVDDNDQTPKKYGVRGIPTIMLFDQGEAVGTKVGALSKSQLNQFIEETLYIDDEEEEKEFETDEYLAIAMVGGRLKLIGLSPDGKFHFKDQINEAHTLIHNISLDALAMQEAIDELEYLINNPKSKEKDFHDFFERNEGFLLNDEYRCAHSKIVLERQDEGPLIPDFVMQPVQQSQLCDLLELKTPNTQLFVLQKNRTRFSAAVLEAAAQLRTYSEFFDEAQNRELIMDRYGLAAYKPRMMVILGRTGNISAIERKKIQTNLNDVAVKTYDDILESAKFKIKKRKIL